MIDVKTKNKMSFPSLVSMTNANDCFSLRKLGSKDGCTNVQQFSSDVIVFAIGKAGGLKASLCCAKY